MNSGPRIAILKGGPGSERAVSLASAAGVSKALRELGAEVHEIDISSATFDLPPGIEIAFNLIHGTFGEDGQLQDALDKRGVLYTGEGAAESRLAFDKIASKERFVAHHVPTPKSEVLRDGNRPTLDLPLVVKAPREGSSVGVYIVKNPDELEAALRGASEFDSVTLIEQFVRGKELTVGILGDLALPVIEICPHEGFYDFKNKYPFLNPQGGARHFCPAPLSPEQTQEVQRIALAAHRALGLQVYSRVDVLLPDSGEPTVLEVNTIPGMTEASLLPEAAAAAGISYAQLCERIIELSLCKRQP
jgi:D-alanine-D-alanine ligase